MNFKPGEKTFVTVRFEPARAGTLVSVRHHGFGALGDGHPVRHGLVGAEFSRMIGTWLGGAHDLAARARVAPPGSLPCF